MRRLAASPAPVKAMTAAETTPVQADLWVLRDNAVARRFYERLGSELVGERADEQSGVTLVELAYGWSDLSRLVT